jgi:hypothetical protein
MLKYCYKPQNENNKILGIKISIKDIERMKMQNKGMIQMKDLNLRKFVWKSPKEEMTNDITT